MLLSVERAQEAKFIFFNALRGDRFPDQGRYQKVDTLPYPEATDLRSWRQTANRCLLAAH
ncbi:hypothetical protein Q669_20385 [Labrenzia sp. C1B10]|nr:hypothetical protein Q669_20385 [Labrenzia sp. C1B10]ERS03334.1 hypothetical protein Q675_04830 [Labrenzia sp. C1B70]